MISSNDSKNYRRISGQSGDRNPYATGVTLPSARYTAAGGETSLNLQTLSQPLSYTPGANNLQIISSLGSYIRAIDYYETSSTTISFVQPLQADEILQITVLGLFTGNTYIPNTMGVISQSSSTLTLAYTDDYIRCNATSNNITITLPTAAGVVGKVYHIKKVDSSVNSVTINTTSSQTIDGALSKTIITQYQVISVISNGTNWDII